MFIDKSSEDSSGAHLWAKDISLLRSCGFIFGLLDYKHSAAMRLRDKRNWFCVLGLRYVKGLSEQSGKAIMRERMKSPFVSIDDLHQRVPELRKDEMRKLAAVGALNFIQESPTSNVQRPTSKTKAKQSKCPKSNVQSQRQD